MWRRNVSTTCSDSPSPHEPGVDVHAGELGADGPVDERGGHRGVDPAGQPADGPAVADLGPHGLDLRLDDRRHRPGRAAAAHVEQEPASAAPGRPACGRPRGGTARRGSAARRAPARRRRRPPSGPWPRSRRAPARSSRSGSSTPAGPVGRRRAGRWPRPWPSARSARTRPGPVCGHLAAELLGDELGAVADARGRGRRGRRPPASITGAPGTCTLFGPPLKITPAGARAASSAAVIVCGTISE